MELLVRNALHTNEDIIINNEDINYEDITINKGTNSRKCSSHE